MKKKDNYIAANIKVLLLIIFCYTAKLISGQHHKILHEQLYTITPDKVCSVEFIYLPKQFFIPQDISTSDEIFGYTSMLRCKVIRDEKNIEEYVKLLQRLEKSNKANSCDIRILSLVRFYDKEQKTIEICFSEFGCILYNGVQMQSDHSLFDFLDKLLYAPLKNEWEPNCGFDL